MSLSLNYPTISPSLLLDFANSGRLDPQVTFTRSSTATFFDETGVLRTANNDVPRFDYNPATLAAQGLLIEESRTNSIRNNTMVGAAAGTPGTNPTNWIVGATADGLTKEIVGTGTQNGITYVDIRWSGTSGAGSTTTLAAFEANTQIAALNTQAWSGSSFIALVGGTLTNVSLLELRIRYLDSGGTLLQQGGVSVSSATATLQRFSTAQTAANASIAFVNFAVVGDFVNSSAVDFTLRIGLPQLEQGAFATSVIPTTTTALTRAADVASVNTLSPWYNASAGTIYADFAGRVSGAQPYIIMLSNTGETERIYQRYVSGQYQSIARVAGVDIASVYNSSEGSAVNAKIATAYDSSQLATSTNGQAVTGAAVASLSSVPSGLNKLWLGSFAGTSSFTNGYLRRITYYPRRLSNAELQSLTV